MPPDANASVVICGGGPVGLMLAVELRTHGVGVTVLERLADVDRRVKAGAIHGRAAEMLDRRGLTERVRDVQHEFLAKMPGRGGAGGRPMPRGHFAGLWELRESGYPSAPTAFVPQDRLEEILAERATELGADVRREHALADYVQDSEGVTVTVDGPSGQYELPASHLVGADGGRSLVRKLGGFAFPGTEGIITGYQALVELDDPEFSPRGWTRHPGGLMVNGPAPGRILMVEFDGPPPDRDAPVTLDELQAAARRITGTGVTLTSASSRTRFTDNARLADSYRSGRVLLAGDAAHVHSPFGGQGLLLGLGDAANLGWKLALVARGGAPDALLDTYTAERRPVAAQVLDNTRAQVALLRPGPHVDALRDIVTRLLRHDDANRDLTDMITGAAVRYDLGSGQDLVGRAYAPDLTVRTATGDEPRLAELQRSGRGLLIAADKPQAHTAAPWAGRVDIVTGDCDLAPGSSILIRPDGFVAWTSDDAEPLEDVLTRWFGTR
ncbi:FAD-dependent monooxygenase [Actinomadura fibrosa]|uniref:FAD-dependent monooxygenase n=1 Tax=Actinomadura fibrosa TaxID=111802 RepID=A0ABW2XC28_9ACTN|nr:FAD-dependent monooxygenase [Actinomadura fibrosa]